MSSSWTFPPESSGARIFSIRFLRNVFILPGFCCLILALAACGDSAVPRTSSSLATPPGSEQRAVEAGQTGRGLDPDGLPALEAPKGVAVGVDKLFAEDIKDPITRIQRLENAVMEMRRDYEATLPAIKRLVAVDKDLQTLMAQLETLINGAPDPAREAALPPIPPLPATPPIDVAGLQENDLPSPVPAVPEAQSPAVPPKASQPAAVPPSAEVETIAPMAMTTATPPAPPAPAKAQPPPEPVQTAPPASPPVTKANAPPTEQANAPPVAITAQPQPASTPQQPKAVEASGVSGLGVRLGEGGGKTRLVVDLNRSVTHRTDLDNDEKILVIEVNEAGWSAPANKTFTSPIIQSYASQPLENQKGTRLIITLKKPVTIAYDSLLPPEANNKNYRLVIDLKGK